MKILIQTLGLGFLLLVSFVNVKGQNQIKGKVTDEKGAPVGGVKIFINNLNQVVSEKDGSFKLGVNKLDFPIKSNIIKEGHLVEEVDFDEDANFISIKLEVKKSTHPTVAKPAPNKEKFNILVVDSLGIALSHVKIVVEDNEYFTDEHGLITLEKTPEIEKITCPIFKITSSEKSSNQIKLILKPIKESAPVVTKLSLEAENELYYDNTFNVLAEDIQQERKILLQYAAKIQNEIVSITLRLKNDTLLSKTKRLELESKALALENKLIESRAALIKSDDKTGSLIRQLKMVIAKKDSIHEATKAKLVKVTKEKEEADFKVLIYGGLSLVFLVLTILLYFLYSKIQIKNKEIKLKSDQISEQNLVINKQLDEISQSIQAAKIIQNSILPPIERIHQYLPNSLVYYKPKDIVGGDFYWFRAKGDIIYLAAIDCTGHGVPGALTSMMGFNLLNQVFQQHETPNAALILNEVNARFIRSTSNEQTDVLKSSIDGMDVSICKININERKLEYAGAKLPLFLIRDNEMLSTKGSAFPIGTVRNGKLPEYTDTEVELLPNDMLYIGSDGYTSQMGGPDGTEKYNNARFKKLLLEIAKKPLNEQLAQIDKEIMDWKGNYDQLDDILLMGFKI